MVPWILISVIVILIILGIVAIAASKKGRKRPTDYYAFFIMGIIWLPFGIIFMMMRNNSIGPLFFILGLVYAAIGLAHKKDWKKNKQPPLIESAWWRWSIVCLGVLVFLGLLFFYFAVNDNVIGGDRGEYGCLGPAGYSWNESELSCVREWESGDNRYQVTNFITCEAAGYDVMESYPRQCRALNGDLFVEEIEDWKLDGVSLMRHSETGEYACFGCSEPEESPALCIDPILEMVLVEETFERYCGSDFEVVE